MNKDKLEKEKLE